MFHKKESFNFGFLFISLLVLISTFIFCRCYEINGWQYFFDEIYFVINIQNFVPGHLSLDLIIELLSSYMIKKKYKLFKYQKQKYFKWSYIGFAWSLLFLSILQQLLERVLVILLLGALYTAYEVGIKHGGFSGVFCFLCIALHFISFSIFVYSLAINQILINFICFYFNPIVFGWVGLYPNFKLVGSSGKFQPYSLEKFKEKYNNNNNKITIC